MPYRADFDDDLRVARRRASQKAFRDRHRVRDTPSPRRIIKPSPPDPNPVSIEEYMEALQWQGEHPWHELACEAAEAIARAMRRWRAAASSS